MTKRISQILGRLFVISQILGRLFVYAILYYLLSKQVLGPRSLGPVFGRSRGSTKCLVHKDKLGTELFCSAEQGKPTIHVGHYGFPQEGKNKSTYPMNAS